MNREDAVALLSDLLVKADGPGTHLERVAYRRDGKTHFRMQLVSNKDGGKGGGREATDEKGLTHSDKHAELQRLWKKIVSLQAEKDAKTNPEKKKELDRAVGLFKKLRESVRKGGGLHKAEMPWVFDPAIDRFLAVYDLQELI